MRVFSLILLFFTICTYAQKVKQVKNKLSKYEYETYTVIKQKGKLPYKHGEYKHYKYSRLIETGTYEQGNKAGKWIENTQKGRLEYFYSFGNIDSFYGPINDEIVAIKFDAEGNEVSKYYYSSPAKILKVPSAEGTQLIKTANYGFIENDTIALGYLKNDAIEGPWSFKNSDGSYCKLQFVKGQMVGKQTSFYSSGKLFSTLTYNDSSELNGPYIINYENGDTLFYQNYINGKQDGYGTAKYPDGKTFYTALYNNGRLLSFKEYHLPQKLSASSSVINGNGTINEYIYLNGNLLLDESATYENGILNGLRLHYKEDTLYYSEKYENGLFVDYQKKPTFEWEREEIDTLFPRINFDLVDTLKFTKSTFEGGENRLQRFLAENIRYPNMAIENDVQGQVMVKFEIDRLGTVTKTEVISKKLGFGMEEESMRVIKATSSYWKPAVYYGIPVKMRFRIPLKYQLF